MNYNPQQYWQDRGQDYSVAVDTSAELEHLSQLVNIYVPSNRSVLEVGSGYGRVFEYLMKQTNLLYDNIYLCDFVNSMRYECQSRTGVFPDKWDGVTLPYDDKMFGLVISFSVMLHVPPADIINHWSEHVRVCDKYMFVATYNGPSEGTADHCFSHAYEDFIYAFGMKMVDRKEFMNGARVNYFLERMI